MHDVITGLEYLASRHIASRDVTAFDMIVAGRGRRGGCAGELLDILTTEDFTVKLTSFGLAHYFREPDTEKIRLGLKNSVCVFVCVCVCLCVCLCVCV